MRFAIRFAALAVLLAGRPLPSAAGQGDPLAAIRADRWADAEAAAAGYADPVAEKLVMYYRLLAPGAARAGRDRRLHSPEPRLAEPGAAGAPPAGGRCCGPGPVERPEAMRPAGDAPPTSPVAPSGRPRRTSPPGHLRERPLGRRLGPTPWDAAPGDNLRERAPGDAPWRRSPGTPPADGRARAPTDAPRRVAALRRSACHRWPNRRGDRGRAPGLDHRPRRRRRRDRLPAPVGRRAHAGRPVGAVPGAGLERPGRRRAPDRAPRSRPPSGRGGAAGAETRRPVGLRHGPGPCPPRSAPTRA